MISKHKLLTLWERVLACLSTICMFVASTFIASSVVAAPGDFTDSGQALGLSNSFGVALGDLDADGDLDAFIANESQPNKVWFNDGSGTFTDSGQFLGNARSHAVVLADVDNDGDLDALVANSGIAIIPSLIDPDRIWLNDGNGVFSDSIIMPAVDSNGGAVAA